MSAPARFETKVQTSAYRSPWSLRVRLSVGLWAVVWAVCFRPTPNFFNRWRLFLLRLFGSQITGLPFVAPSSFVKMPWNLTLEDRACLGAGAEVYNLGPAVLRARCTIAQQTYLCGGTHDLTLPNLPLVVGLIEVGEDAFVGARAFVLPGLLIGTGAVVGACAVVTKDVPPWTVVAGNPAKTVGERKFEKVADKNPAPGTL